MIKGKAQQSTLVVLTFGYWRLRGSFCQNIQLGMKLEAPYDVSGPSMMPRVTCERLMVALSVATACVCVRPQRLTSSTERRRSPFCGREKGDR